MSSPGSSCILYFLISDRVIFREDILASDGENSRVRGEVSFAFLGSDAEFGDKGRKLGDFSIPCFFERGGDDLIRR